MVSSSFTKDIKPDALFGKIMMTMNSEGLSEAISVLNDHSDECTDDIKSLDDLLKLLSNLDGMSPSVLKYNEDPSYLQKELISDGFTMVSNTKKVIKRGGGGKNRYVGGGDKSVGSGNRYGGGGDKSVGSGNRYGGGGDKSVGSGNRYGGGGGNRRPSRPAGPNDECRYCHDTGHFKQDCPKLSQKGKWNKDSDRSNYSGKQSPREPEHEPEPERTYSQILEDDFPTLAENNKPSIIHDDTVLVSNNHVSNFVKNINDQYPALSLKKRGVISNSKPTEPKVEEPKVEEPKVEEPKVEEPKVEEPKVEKPKVDTSVGWGSGLSLASKIKAAESVKVIEETKNSEVKLRDAFDDYSDDDEKVKMDVL